MANKMKTTGITIDSTLLETVEQIAAIQQTTAQELFENYARQYILDNSQELAREIVRLRSAIPKPQNREASTPVIPTSAPVKAGQ